MQEVPAIFPIDIPKPSLKTILLDLSLLIVGLSLLLLIFGYLRPLARPDSLADLEIAREMLANHNWVTPTLNNVIHLDFPPLFYWLTALSFKLFGYTLFAARLWPAIFGIIGIVAFYLYGVSAYSRRMGWLCALVSSSSMLYLTLMTAAAPYIMGSVLITISLLCSSLPCYSISEGHRRRLYLGFWVACAINTLLLGLMGLLLPLCITILYYLTMNYRTMYKELASIRGIVLYFVIVLPWFILVQNHNPNFLHYFFLEKIHANYLSHFSSPLETLSLIFCSAFAALIPWTLLANLGFWASKPVTWATRFDRPLGMFIFIWIVVSFIYLIGIAPAGDKSLFWIGLLSPALALAIAKALNYYWELSDHNLILESRRLLVVVLFLATAFFCLLSQKTSSMLFGFHTTANTEKILAIIFILFLIGGVASYFTLRLCEGLKATTLVFTCTGIILTITLVSTLPKLRQDSFLPISDYISAHQKPGDVIASYQNYYPELSFNLKLDPQVVIDWKNMPGYGAHYQNTQSWVVNSAFFWKTIAENKRKIFVLVPVAEVTTLAPVLMQNNLEPVVSTNQLILFTSKAN